jgi:rSAM/selenodomain-associated transferase 1
MKTAVVVMLKNPVPGKVKTRLSRKYGKRGAARIHTRLTEQLLSGISGLGNVDIYLSVTPGRAHVRAWHWARVFGMRLKVQAPGDLGEKMLAECSALARQYQAVIIVGSDCPEVDASVLEQCRKLLQSNDVVIGPAEDGGYYLLGLRRCMAGMFRNISWGTGIVFRETERRLQSAGVSYACLEYRYDVDRPEDVIRLKRSMALTGYSGDWIL